MTFIVATKSSSNKLLVKYRLGVHLLEVIHAHTELNPSAYRYRVHNANGVPIITLPVHASDFKHARSPNHTARKVHAGYTHGTRKLHAHTQACTQKFYCDRSGLLCTLNDPIYIHEKPLELIRVISSFSLMSPSKLGWDTTMKLVTNKITLPRYSFDSEIPLDLLPHDAEEINWEITLGASYEVMIGKATLVWKAVCVKGDHVHSSPHSQQ
ncbi:hypothetical protein CPC08DRAFT_773586, partial [Agrocybe pediades]